MFRPLRPVFYCAFALTFIAGWHSAATAAQDDSKQSTAAQIAAIKKEHQELEKRFHEELVAAKRDMPRVQKANQEHSKAASEMAGKLKGILKEHGQQPEAFEGVLVLIGQVRYPLDDELTRMVVDNHVANPGMGELCFHLRYRGGEAWAEKILNAVAEKHPSKEIRGQAAYALADACVNQILERRYQRELPAEQKSRLREKATQLYEQIVANHAQTTTPDGKTTLAKKARHELARLKNLPSLVVGGTAPPIVGEDLEGKEFKLAEFRGKVVLLVFWGSWCGPCMAMVPHERELYEKHKDAPFVLLGVNCGDTRELAQATVEKQRMGWRMWWDGEEIRGPIQTEYDVPHWPRIFLIDASGVIRGIDLEGEELDRAIEAALKDV